MRHPILHLVLDTNVWLDWLVAAAQAACLAECRRIARKSGSDPRKSGSDPDSLGWGLTPISPPIPLPRCADPGDQIFLEAALAARADFLVTRDRALLALGGRFLPFQIVRPDLTANFG